MNYIQWNNAISSYFFNSENSDKNIFLYADRKTIIDIGKENLSELEEDEIWTDYIHAIKMGLPGCSNGNLLDKAIYSYYKWKEGIRQIDNYPVEKPLYTAYLVSFVIPLTFYPGEFRANSYYPIAEKFTKEYNLPHIPHQTEDYNWNTLWSDLEEWSIMENNLALGGFDMPKFKIERWKYVGKPLSQCLLPTNALNRLPVFFDTAGLVPNENITDRTFRTLLTRYGIETLYLTTNVLNLITDESDELGQSLINIVKKAYHDWTGITDQKEEDEEEIKKGWTVSKLHLCIKTETKINFTADFYYRLYSTNEFPEDLCFNNSINCQQQINNWSKPIFIPFQNIIEIEDSFNNWKARFSDKSIWIFIQGDFYGLNHWIETNRVKFGFEMLLLVKKEIVPVIKNWLTNCAKHEELDLANIPANYCLFRINNPSINHNLYDELNVPTEINIQLIGGIKVDRNSYLKNNLPVIQLENGKGDEKVYIIYYGENEKRFLEADDKRFGIWKLPDDIKLSHEFNVSIDNYELAGTNKRYRIIDDKIPIENLNLHEIPRRNKFGHVIVDDSDNPVYSVGSLAKGINYRRQEPYLSQFYPFSFPDKISSDFTSDEIILKNETILKYLTIKNITSSKEYFELFESLYFKHFPLEVSENHPSISFIKRSSLNILDYLGHIDYEYSLGKIHLTHPQLIPIPSTNGIKTLLIGARTEELLFNLREKCIENNLHFQMQPQDATIDYLLLPATVTITAYSKINGMYPDRIFENISNDCGVLYNSKELPQFGLNEFSGTIGEYINALSEDINFQDFNWVMKAFNPNSLKFEKIERNNVDTSLCLIEYKLNEYTYKHRLWIDNKIYIVDKNWGRFIVLHKLNINIIYNDRDRNIIAIPSTTPLPRLLAEALLLQSGRSPVQKWLEIDNVKCYFNIYENTIHTLAYNSFKKIGQTVIVKNIEL